MNATRMYLSKLAALSFAAILMLVTLTHAAPIHAATSGPVFRDDMRKLWEDHITWTRLYIVSAAAGLPDTTLTAQRLLDNQTDIGNAIKPFYGEAAGNQLTALLKDHILGAADLLAAARAGDQAKVQAASKKWYDNADAIAAFLNGANPKNWPLAALKEGMKMHLDLTLAEAVARLNGKYPDDIKAYDTVHQHILGLADALSSGIVSQFPEKSGTGDTSTTQTMPSMLPATGAGAQETVSLWIALLAGSLIAVTGLLILKRSDSAD